MKFTLIQDHQWEALKEIYLEAFPKQERKPFFALRHSVKKGTIQLYTTTEEHTLLGFIAVIPYQDMIMVDYLAVSGKIRSKGTGSYILQEICKLYANKKIVLLIERLDNNASNSQQRIARRKFYFKNGFTSSGIYINGKSGEMEVLNLGGQVSPEEYLALQKYALGNLFFRLSKITITK